MLTRLIILWIVFASILGFVVGSTFVWSLTVPAICQTEQQSANPDSHKECKTQAEEHSNLSKWWDWTTDDSAAFYTFILCFLTVLLVAATGILGVGTFIAAHAARDAAEHIPRVERAYIYGGFGPQQNNRRFDRARGLITVGVTLANYGKTPAFVHYIEVGLARLDELPPEPIFDFGVPISDYYFPLMTMNDVRVVYTSDITVPAWENWVVFQRVHYRDVLGQNRFSGCAFHFIPVEKDGVWLVAEQLIALDSLYWATSDTPPKA